MASRPTILLVHGGHHGSWCWKLLTPELHALGWTTQTVDLPVSDPDLGALDYVQSIEAQVRRVPMVAVGHSMAGAVIPLLVGRLPVRGLVFLNAITPVPGKSVSQQNLDEPGSKGPTADALGRYRDGVRHPNRQGARDLYYHDCSDDLANWALDRLVPQAARVITEVTPVAQWPPEIPAVAIIGTEDRAIPYAWAKDAMGERLGQPAIEFPGGHSPFLSLPQHLARVMSAAIESLLKDPREELIGNPVSRPMSTNGGR